LRYIGAAYATGDACCWEAAYSCVDHAPEGIDGALFVARAASLVRAIRCNRACEFCYLPSSCRRLSLDEAKLMALIEGSLDKGLAASAIAPGSHAWSAGTIDAIGAVASLWRQSRRQSMRLDSPPNRI
jgi:hypothetical protein